MSFSTCCTGESARTPLCALVYWELPDLACTSWLGKGLQNYLHVSSFPLSQSSLKTIW